MAYTYHPIVVRPAGSINQSLKTRVELEGTEYVFLFYFNAVDTRWYFDLLRSGETAICRGIKMILGVDLLWSYHGYNGAPQGALVCIDRSGADAEPGLDGFDERVLLVYRAGSAD
jgi:hypothetical protein